MSIFSKTHLLAQATDAEPVPLAPVQGLVNAGAKLVNTLIPLLFALALLVFVWGVVKFIFNSGNELKKSEGKRVMIGGIIALFVIASVWGIVAFIGKSLKIDQSGTIKPPAVDQTISE
jgi:hypothetical protein